MICKSLTAGYFYNTARQSKTGEYRTVKNQHTVYIHPSSVYAKEEDPPKWLMYFELAFTTKEYMRMIAPIQGSWLVELAPHYYQAQDIEDTDSKKVPNAKAIGKATGAVTT
jgi:pre-mRNA-splicing factor ATP-dependent RNA helicase DHX16